MSLLVVAVVMGIYAVAPGPAVVLLPAWIAACGVVVLAAGLWLSALNVRYRDVRSRSPFLIQVWLFVSPVVYPSSLVEGGWQYVYALNPMVTVLDGFRWSLADAPAPGPESLVSSRSSCVVARRRAPLLPSRRAAFRGSHLTCHSSIRGSGARQAIPARSRAATRPARASRDAAPRGRAALRRARCWALRDVDLDDRAGRGRRHHRAERRGQDDAAEDPRPHRHGRPRESCASADASALSSRWGRASIPSSRAARTST